MIVPVVSLSNGCILRPYTADLVEEYHNWFTRYPDLLEATATEPLSLEEERENQISWTDDPHKVTFILYSPDGDMIGDVNCFIDDLEHDDGHTSLSGEINVMIAVPQYRRRGYAQAAVEGLMKFVAEKFPGLSVFIAKIGEENVASQALFKRMGFQEVRRVTVFSEVHFEKQIQA